MPHIGVYNPYELRKTAMKKIIDIVRPKNLKKNVNLNNLVCEWFTTPKLKYEFLLGLYGYDEYEIMTSLIVNWTILIQLLQVSREYRYNMYNLCNMIWKDNVLFVKKLLNQICNKIRDSRYVSADDFKNFMHIFKFLIDNGWYREALNGLSLLETKIGIPINFTQLEKPLYGPSGLFATYITLHKLKIYLSESYINEGSLNEAANLVELTTPDLNAGRLVPNLSKIDRIALETDFYSHIAKFHEIMGNFTVAAHYSNKALQKILKSLNCFDEHTVQIEPKIVIDALTIASQCHAMTGDCRKSEIYIECALKITKTTYGTNSLLYAQVVTQYGNLQFNKADWYKAQKAYRWAYMIFLMYYSSNRKRNTELILANVRLIRCKFYRGKTHANNALMGIAKQLSVLYYNFCAQRNDKNYLAACKLHSFWAQIKLEIVQFPGSMAGVLKTNESLDWLYEELINIDQIFTRPGIEYARQLALTANGHLRRAMYTQYPTVAKENLRDAAHYANDALNIIKQKTPHCYYDLASTYTLNGRVIRVQHDDDLRYIPHVKKPKMLQLEKYLLASIAVCQEKLHAHVYLMKLNRNALNWLYTSYLGQRSFDIFELNEKRQQNLILSDVFDVERAVYQEYIKNDTCSCLNCRDYNCVKCVTCECNKKCLVIKNPNETIKLQYILSRELHCVQTRSMN